MQTDQSKIVDYVPIGINKFVLACLPNVNGHSNHIEKIKTAATIALLKNHLTRVAGLRPDEVVNNDNFCEFFWDPKKSAVRVNAGLNMLRRDYPSVELKFQTESELQKQTEIRQ